MAAPVATVHANDLNGELVPVIGEETPFGNLNFSVQDDDGSIIFFQTADDRDAYLKMSNKPITRAPGDYGHTVREKVISTKKTKHQWVGYNSMTTSWAKASQYVLHKGSGWSVSGSYTYAGFTVSIGFKATNGVDTHIKANPKKYSRLGVWGDFTYKKMQYQDYYYNVKQGKPRYGVRVTRTAKYVAPKYK